MQLWLNVAILTSDISTLKANEVMSEMWSYHAVFQTVLYRVLKHLLQYKSCDIMSDLDFLPFDI